MKSIDELIDSDQPLPEPDSAPEQELHWQRQQRATAQYVISLDQELQRFIQLRFVDEHSQYEVMDQMKITRRRVRTLEKKVQVGLRKFLIKQGLR